jgi:heme-degrading monooxygenase HmoA
MHARASTITGAPGQADEERRLFESELLPQLEQVDGFKGVLALADNSSGKSLVVTIWESEQAMQASEERANQMRSDAAARFGATSPPQVDRYEVVFHKAP